MNERTGQPGRTLLLVSPLAPPAGGIATWTEILLRRGLPAPWRVRLVDTARRGEGGVFAARGARSEWRRTMRILSAAARELHTAPSPDVLHLNVDPLNLGFFRDATCGLLGRARGARFVLHHHGEVSRLVDHAPRWQRTLFRRCVRAAAANLVMTPNSHAFLAALCEGSASRVIDLPNFYDELAPRPLATAKPERAAVLFVGGLTRAKGAHHVCEVAARVPEADFVLLGAKYEETSAEIARATPNLRALGEVSASDVASWLARASLLLFPTAHAEGFPYSILEAMVAGLPVISSDAGAIARMIEVDRGGFIERADDAAALASRVHELLGDGAKRSAFGAYNNAKAKRLYAFDVVGRALADIYDRCGS